MARKPGSRPRGFVTATPSKAIFTPGAVVGKPAPNPWSGGATPTPTPTLSLSVPAPSIASNAASGTLVSNISNVPTGATPTVTPNDGRLFIAGDASAGWKVVVGMSALSAGTVNFSVAATGATGASGVLTVTAAASYTGLVGTRTYEAYSYLGTGGQTLTDRTGHYLTESIGAANPVAFTYGNWAVATASSSPSGSGVETACSNDITISVDVQYPIGTKIGALSFGGNPSTIMPGGTAVEVDGIYSGATIPAGVWIALVPTLVVGSVNTGTRAGPPYTAISTGSVEVSALGDGPFTYGGSTAAGRKYFPKAISAQTTKKTFFLLTDSRGTGQGGAATSNGDSGEFAPSISTAYAYHNGGVPGDRADWFADSTKSTLRRARLARFGFGASAGDARAITIVNLGINDVRAGRTVANCLTNDTSVIALCKKAYIATMSPQTTGAWTAADGSDQVIPATDSVRTGVNDARRVAGYAGSAGTIEIADVTESTRNSGKWKADGTAAKWTADGLHETTYAYDQVRAAGVVNPATL